MAFTKLLCPTDFSLGARNAMRLAIRMAREQDAELVLAHAWFIPPTAFAMEAAFPSYIIQEIIDDAQRALDTAVAEATAQGVRRVTGKLLSGMPWLEIVEELGHRSYDLCIIGTHGRTGIARVLLGSVAERVVRHAPCSVMTVRPDCELGPFRHALVPTDFSASAANAAVVAGSLIEPGGALTLLHVIELPSSVAGELPLGEFAAELDKGAAIALEGEVARVRGGTSARVTARTRIGVAGAQALAALDGDLTIDLVVMGSHGRTGLQRILMGSVAEKVVRHARCPVFIARPRVQKELT